MIIKFSIFKVLPPFANVLNAIIYAQDKTSMSIEILQLNPSFCNYCN